MPCHSANRYALLRPQFSREAPGASTSEVAVILYHDRRTRFFENLDGWIKNTSWQHKPIRVPFAREQEPGDVERGEAKAELFVKHRIGK